MKYASKELREQAVRLWKSEKYTQSEIAEIVGYSLSAVKDWLRKDRSGEAQSPTKRGCRPRALTQDDLDLISRTLANRNDTTLKELAEMLDNKCCLSVIHRAVHRLNLTFKKNASCR